MEWVLCLGHAVVGAILLVFHRAGPDARRRAIELAAATGAGLGVALVGAGAAGGRAWRSVAFEPETAVPAGFAVACAWVLVGAVGARGGRVEAAALAGVASSGLALAATGRFVVPSLLFWLCSSVALAGLAWTGGAPRVWPALVASDAAVCLAAVLYVVREDEWAVPDPASGPVFWALAAAAGLRGALHLSGPGSATGTHAVALAPLLTGGAISLAARGGRAEPWAALAVLAAGALGLALSLRRDRASARAATAWPPALALAVCLVSPGHAPLAGAVAALAVGAAALMPSTGDRAGFERGLLLAAVPLTAGFGLVAAGATESFARATDAATALDSAPWTAVAALLPAGLAGGVLLAARAARATAAELVPEAVLATWLLLGASVVTGFAPGVVGGRAPGLGASGGVAVLYVIAALAGAGAAFAASRGGLTLSAAPSLGPATPLPAEGVARPVAWACAGAGVLVAATGGWLTVWGLSVGFL